MNQASAEAGFYGWKLLAAFWVILFINLAFPAYGSSVTGMSGGFTQVMAHAVVHLQDIGNTTDAAAASFSVLVASTLLGKVMLGVFGDRIDPRYLWAIAVGFFGIGMLVLLDVTTAFRLHVLPSASASASAAASSA